LQLARAHAGFDQYLQAAAQGYSASGQGTDA
jgi:hypothetical protein